MDLVNELNISNTILAMYRYDFRNWDLLPTIVYKKKFMVRTQEFNNGL